MPYMTGNMMCRNYSRFPKILEKGDTIEALGFTGVNSGFSGDFEVRAVEHWGVFARLIPSKYHSTRKEYLKKHWKIKWKNIHQYHLK